MNRVKPSLWIPMLAVGLSLLVTWPVWRWLWAEWTSNEYYSHGLLIVPIALFLAWRQWSGHPSPAEGDSRGLILVALSLALYLFLVTQKAYYLAALAMIGLIGGLVWTFGGGRLAKGLAFPVLFLGLMVPLPFVERLTIPLAQLTGVCSGAVTRLLGVDVAISGSSVTLPDTQLVIGAQCSGINSIITLLALTSLIAYVMAGPWWGKLLLVFLAVPLAMLGNIVRVANLLVVARYWGVDAAFRVYHDYSGIVVFVLVLLLMIPLTRLLQCRTVRPGVL